MISWFAFAFVVAGLLLLAKKNIWGFVVINISQVLWAVVGIQIANYPLIIQSFINICLNIYAIVCWKKDSLSMKKEGSRV